MVSLQAHPKSQHISKMHPNVEWKRKKFKCCNNTEILQAAISSVIDD